MCGRFALTVAPEEIKAMFGLEALSAFPPRYNIAPTQPILTIGAGLRAPYDARLVRWGLVPSWVKDPDAFSLLINGRAETAHEKPSFKNAMRHSRVIIPASGWYEWHRKGDKKQPYHIQLKSKQPILMGGLVETWSDSGGSEVDTGCILTTPVIAGLSHVHHRMPVIISPQNLARWLDCKTQEPRHVVDLLVPDAQLEFEAVPVSDMVNSVANNDESIQRPLDNVVQKRVGNYCKKSPKTNSDQLKLF